MLMPAQIPIGLDMQAWETWVAYRKELKKPFKTARGTQAAMEAMAKLGPNQMAAVQYSMSNEYQGLFEPKNLPKEAPIAPQPMLNKPREVPRAEVLDRELPKNVITKDRLQELRAAARGALKPLSR